MRILLRLIGALFRLLFYPLYLLGWRRAARQGSYVTLDIDGAVTDIRPPPRFIDRFRRDKPPLSLHGLHELIETIIADPRIKGMIVTLRGFRQGAASALSLRALLKRARDAGRDVVIHLPFGAGTQEIYIATAGSRILAGPTTTLAPLGFLAQARYLRGALEKANLVPEVYARGRYKSAGERLMRSAMSETEREQLSAILDQRYASLLDAIAEGRKVDTERARALVDGAPYLPGEATAEGLIDGAAYDDELKGVVKGGATSEEAGKDKEKSRLPTVGAGRYLAARRALRIPRVLPEAVFGVIEVHGTMARQSPFAAELRMATDDALIAAVRAARSNPRVRGVLLHINSPGGSALASDRMHHELAALAEEKPLVACMADVAASGGYYVAAAAHVIVAQPSTVTGSIGVVAARLVIDPLLERLGVATEVLKRGLHADLINPTRALRDDEKVVLEREIEGIYQAFLRVVAAGRKLPIERVEEVAEGRVWTGADAQKAGLVDELGGFQVALDILRSRVGEGGAKLQPAVLRPPRHPTPPLDPPVKKAAELLAGAAELALRAGIDPAPSALALSGDRVLAWCPEAAALL
jgi:protease-4